VTRIVTGFLNEFLRHESVQNPLVVKRHDAAYHPELAKHWIAFVTQSAQGPRRYKGRTMKSAHAGLRITDAEFDATIDIMAQSLERSDVGVREQTQLLALMRTQRKNIVEVPIR